LPNPARCVCSPQGVNTRCGQSCSSRGISGACSRARGDDSSVSNCGSSDCLDPNPALGAAAQQTWMPGNPMAATTDTQHTDIAEDAVPAARSRSHVVMGLHERSEQASGGRCTALPHPPLDVLRPSQRRLEARPECWDGISVSPQAIQEHFSPHSKCLVGLQHTLLASVARGGEEGSRSAIDADLQRGQAAIVYSTTHVRPNTIGESGYRPAQHILITEAIREEGFPKKKTPSSRRPIGP